ncbi:MAG: hypothetical protein LBK63_04010 [Treponema sp.]|jgi:hypothetical protein|nr:hypothetical protein [Treponema sp.]
MRNKQILRRWVFSLAAVLLFAACENQATLNELYYYPKEIWGEWIRMDTGNTFRFGSNWRQYSGSDIDSDAVFEKQSENVVKITQKGKTDIYLFASRLPTASFSGTIVGIDDPVSSVGGSRAIGGLGGMPVMITNLNDRNNNVTAQTTAEGTYEAKNIVIDDEYAITVGGETTNVTVNTNGDDVGTITIVPDGVNFKTTLERRGDSANQDMSRLWVGGRYYFNIVIENTGDRDCLAPSYALNPDAGILLTNTNLSGQFTTIEPGKSKSIPIEILCSSVNGESENKKIDITIDSALDGRSWNDSVSLKFNLDYVYLNIRSDGDGERRNAVSGIIIVPGAKAYSFTAAQSSSKPYSDKGSYKTYVLVPKYSGKDYLVVFSGASAANETYYSFRISGRSDDYQDAPDLSGFDDVAAGEIGSAGNNSESSAYYVADPNAGFKAYLHKNDVDFYRIRF